MKDSRHRIRGIDILYEDSSIIVIEKAEGILTEETRKREAFTVENALNNYVRKGQSRSSRRIWLVHRLDRDTSGILVVAKSLEVREKLAAVWHTEVIKTYMAAVWGVPEKEKDTLSGYLYEDRNLFVRQLSTSEAKKLPPEDFAQLKFAETEYEVVARGRNTSLLKIHLHTGRRNQIRVQMAAIGHPLVGDRKYGPHAPAFKDRMCLHAMAIDFPHPATGEQMHFETKLPPVFQRLAWHDLAHHASDSTAQ